MKIINALVVTVVNLAYFSFAMEAKDEHVSSPLPILSENSTKENWLQFAQAGGGYYPIPKNLEQYIQRTLELADSLNESYKDKLGYHSETKQQIEYLYLEKKAWVSLPEETKALAEGMNRLAVSILLNVLQALGVNEELYSQATGGLSDLHGINYLKIAHYDSSKNYPGILWHKDIRWITVLYINQEGLQGRTGEDIFDIKPRKGYFVVHAGIYLEAFINNPKKLTALIHQVRKLDKNRNSFGLFCQGDYPEAGFYQLNNEQLVWKNAKEIDAFLVKDDDNSFLTGPHIIFDEDLKK